MSHEWQHFRKNLVKVTGTSSSVAAAGQLPRTQVEVGIKGGIIVQLGVSTANSVLYDFRIFSDDTSLAGSLQEIVRVIDITKFYQKGNLNIHWVSTDAPPSPFLYLELDNRSLVAPTGIISVDIWIQGQGTGRVGL